MKYLDHILQTATSLFQYGLDVLKRLFLHQHRQYGNEPGADGWAHRSIGHTALDNLHGLGIDADVATDIDRAIVHDSLGKQGRFKAFFGGNDLFGGHG